LCSVRFRERASGRELRFPGSGVEADLQSLGLAGPAVRAGFGDAVTQVGRYLGEPIASTQVNAEARAS
jgi:hypothetical protein